MPCGPRNTFQHGSVLENVLQADQEAHDILTESL